MEIIDPHFHLWDLNLIRYPWLTAPSTEGLLGDYRPICSNYLIYDYLHDISGLNVVKSIHVEAGAASEDALLETRWLDAISKRPDCKAFPSGIVFFADLTAPDIEDQFNSQCEFSNIRGVRQMLNRHKNPLWNFADHDYLNIDSWLKNFGLLQKYNLSFDLQIYYQQIQSSCLLAQRYPEISIILNHTGMPAEQDLAGRKQWQIGMKKLAKCDNILVKISGLPMVVDKWSEDSVRWFILKTIDIFGTDRCMFASNFPVDKLRATYKQLWSIYQNIVADFSDDERRKMFHDNAQKAYRI